MKINRKWAIALTALFSAGLLLSGAAFAANNTESKTTPPNSTQTDMLDQAVKDGKITQGEADVIRDLRNLRREAFTKLKVDSKALIEKAVQDGRITREQADRMLHHAKNGAKPHMRPADPNAPGNRKAPEGMHHHKPGDKLDRPGMPAQSRDELKARLDKAVQEGKMSKEKADDILKRWDKAHPSPKS